MTLIVNLSMAFVLGLCFFRYKNIDNEKKKILLFSILSFLLCQIAILINNEIFYAIPVSWMVIGLIYFSRKLV